MTRAHRPGTVAGVKDLTKRLAAAAADVRRFSDRTPDVALVLGSGLGAFADTLTGGTSIPYTEIGGMPMSHVAGHAGNLVLGDAEGKSCIAMQGRVHLYEGHPVDDVVFGLRLMIHLGAKTVVITNAAGGIGDDQNVGDLMLIEDQINLTGQNPLVGPNDAELGPRFVDMTQTFDPGLMDLADEGAGALGFSLKRGTYVGVLGPSYETPAEIRFFRGAGGHAVGMSTVLEVIAARHMGARILGVSCITNKAAGLGDEEVLTHAEVQENAASSRERFVSLLGATLRRL
ncbi:MAG: purine-nucleoside phosphorylase [Myxococcota bacterium]